MDERRQRYSAPAPPRQADPFDGVLLVDKPAGPTSHDIVDRIRRGFQIRKVGHGGTLDPMATGLLVILLGRATKLSNLFLGSDKTYEGSIHLGIATNSQDADGEVVSETDPSGVTREQLDAEMQKLTGDILQTPPMVSAVKVDGVPLYKRARKGQVVERKPRLIHVYEFALRSVALPRADFLVRCTKGTYVRTLCADIGDALGCGAHLARLRRTAAGELSVNDAHTLSDLMELDKEALLSRMIPMAHFVRNYRR